MGPSSLHSQLQALNARILEIEIYINDVIFGQQRALTLLQALMLEQNQESMQRYMEAVNADPRCDGKYGRWQGRPTPKPPPGFGARRKRKRRRMKDNLLDLRDIVFGPPQKPASCNPVCDYCIAQGYRGCKRFCANIKDRDDT